MKILSHEVAMNSSHAEYRAKTESSMSFETFFVDEPINGVENLENLQKAQRKTVSFNSYCDDRMRTLQGIIQNLLSMLQDRKSKELGIAENDEVFGYTKVSFKQSYEEFEQLEFSTKGKIQTNQGCIDLDLNFSMTRKFAVENSIDIYTTFDPLVINLDGALPRLEEESFSFDLDNDGQCEQISLLGKNNGYLALDKNKDGTINQGSELFGTITGNGFEELAQYDEDQNSWIDENDPIFDSLQIWLKNKDTKEKELLAIGEVGIGAIYLHSESSSFHYKTEENKLLGEMKSSGIFLKEDGTAGAISQIDLAMHKPNPQTDEKGSLATLLQA